MWVDGETYTAALHSALTQAEDASVAIAFWGKGAREQLFSDWRGRHLRVLCNLAQGGTNPAAIRELQQITGAEVRALDDLHAKMVLTERQLIVGSANASANGLDHGEQDFNGWREAGLVTEDEESRRKAQNWFSTHWTRAGKSVNEDDLQKAEQLWKARNRPLREPAADTPMLDLPSTSAACNRVHFVVFTHGLTEEAEQVRQEVRTVEHSQQTEAKTAASKIDVYEAWSKDDRKVLTNPNSILIGVKWNASRKTCTVSWPELPAPIYHRTFGQGKNRKDFDFVYCPGRKTKWIQDFNFDAGTKLLLKQELPDWLMTLNGSFETGETWPLCDFLEWRTCQKKR
ncbi:phospholipase D family protein [Pseudaquabacterium rugosum]|uniref:Phospholipase D family protein n=1 Tax=Pseudaquabacterium rugosum TaxID=2984194 RepID=A0ABU9BD74_9BURK